MKISVAMCTYDGARFVGEQLESLAAQTRRPDELVVCDDRSSDETAGIVADFARSAPFPVRLRVNESNLGATKNFEQAIQLSEGDVIALADQDDIWHEEKLASLEDVFSRDEKLGLAFSDAELVDENLRPLGLTLWQLVFKASELERIRRGEAFPVFLEKRFTVTGATLAFRARLKEKLLPVPTDTYMIHDGWIGLMSAALAPVALIEKPLVKYRQHEGQVAGAILKPYESTDCSRAEFFRNESNAYLREVPVLSRVLREVEAVCNGEGRERARALESRIEYLQGASAHNLARAEANALAQRIKRVPFIARELLRRRYHRFARGLRSAAGDFLRH